MFSDVKKIYISRESLKEKSICLLIKEDPLDDIIIEFRTINKQFFIDNIIYNDKDYKIETGFSDLIRIPEFKEIDLYELIFNKEYCSELKEIVILSLNEIKKYKTSHIRIYPDTKNKNNKLQKIDKIIKYLNTFLNNLEQLI